MSIMKKLPLQYLLHRFLSCHPHGQENGAKLSLINGSFEATVYKSATESKTISGTISNVVGLN